MNFLGIGFLELAIIGLVAFIFLGPERMVEAARFLGRISREVRKLTAEVREMVDVNELINPTLDEPAKSDQTSKAPPIVPGSESAQASSTTPADSNGPVSFKSARELHREKMEAELAQREASPDAPQEERS